jgi:preprotein translocase subunit YajC
MLALAVAIMQQAPSGLSGALGSPLIMMAVVMGIFYVMLILPQQRQRKKLQEMLGALKAGDKVITNGGIYGTINGLDGDTVILKIADQVKIRVARSAISQVETSEDAK